MISVEAYRVSVGSFAFTAQRNLKAIAKHLKVDSVFSRNGLSCILKPAPFIALFTFLTFAFPKSYETINNFHHLLPFLSVSKNGLFRGYPVMYNLSDPHLLFLKVNYTLMLSGDIECNPGPIIGQPSKSIQGSFNQGDISRFGATAGIQCSCNALVSILYSNHKEIDYWKTFDLDHILMEGDKNFKKLGLTESPYIDQFPKNIVLDEQTISLEFIDFHGEFVSNDMTINFVEEEMLLQHSGALFVIEGYTISIIFQNNKFYVFDSHSRDNLGKKIPNGTSVLLQFENLKIIKEYIRNVYKTNFFNVLYIKVKRSENISLLTNCNVLNSQSISGGNLSNTRLVTNPFKVIQGSVHQADEHICSNADKCTCCAFFSLVFSLVKNPGYWDFKDINFVVEQGDTLYKKLNEYDYFKFDNLPRTVTIMGFPFNIVLIDKPINKVINCNSVTGTIFDQKLNSVVDGFLMIINEKCISVTELSF